MKAADLRIGNYIQSIATKPNDLVVVDIEVLKYIVNKATWYKPIPLTEEWLIKFGFKEYEKKYFIGINYGRYSVKRVGDVFNHWYLNHEFDATKRITSNIVYVHQLQNLYHALTGEELTTQTTF